MKHSLASHRYRNAIALILMLLSIGWNGFANTSPPEKSFSVLFYNVENLFDFVDDGGEYEEYKPKKHNWTYVHFRKKLANVAEVISAADADIVALCEVENRNALQKLQKQLFLKGKKYRHRTIDPSSYSKTKTAILSRFPIENVQIHPIPDNQTYIYRNILEADIIVDSRPFKLFVLHFPSKRKPESFRVAAAQALVKRLLSLPSKTEYVIVGDFNSSYNEGELFFTEKLDDTEGKTALNHVLKTARSSPDEWLTFHRERSMLDENDKQIHYDLWLELPENERYNYYYKGRQNTLDHILVPQSLYDSEGFSYVDNSFSVFTWYGRLLVNGRPFRWQMNLTKKGKEHRGEGYSDHLPIMARFTTGPFSLNTPNTKKIKSEESIVKKSNRSSFESGFEGWLPCTQAIRLSRDTLFPDSGRYSLKVEGMCKKNGTVAYIRLKGKQNHLTFKLKGSGKIAFRARKESHTWVYYTGDGFYTMSKQCRYTQINYTNWRTISFSLPQNVSSGSVYQFEIRTAGGVPLTLNLDTIEW